MPRALRTRTIYRAAGTFRRRAEEYGAIFGRPVCGHDICCWIFSAFLAAMIFRIRDARLVVCSDLCTPATLVENSS